MWSKVLDGMCTAAAWVLISICCVYLIAVGLLGLIVFGVLAVVVEFVSGFFGFLTGSNCRCRNR